MRKLLSMLLCLSLLTAMLSVGAALAEDYRPEIEPVTETIRPGKATLLAFTVPESGPVSLRLVNTAGETVSVIVEDYWATVGRNELWWNGTYESVFAPAGTWQLELSAGEGTVGTMVTVGMAAPYLTNIMSSVELTSRTMTVSFYASVDGLLSVGTVVNGAWTLIDSRNITAGENVYIWDMSAANPAITALTLTLTDAQGYPSNEEHVSVSPDDFVTAEPIATPEPVETEEQPTETPAAEETDAGVPTPEETIAGLPEVDEVMMDEPEDSQTVFTPSHGSPYEGWDTSLNYWTMPMDITDEATVWRYNCLKDLKE